MQLDLSSKITLEMIPERYYRTNDMIESLRQKRFEKLRTNIYKDSVEGSKFVAEKIATIIREKGSLGETCCLALSGGTSTIAVYA